MVPAVGLRWSQCLHCGGMFARMLFFLLLVLLTPVCAQTNSFEGRPIAAVRMNPDEPFLQEAERTAALAPLRIGEPLRMADVRLVMERLYSTGRFDNLVVDAQLDTAGVVVTIQLQPASFIRNVAVFGVPDPPNRGQLVNATKLQLGESFSRPQVRQSTESLLELLRVNGFYLAKVTPDPEPAPVQQMDITFTVESGPRAKYSTPVIKGTPGKSVEEIVKATRWRRFFGLLGWKEMTDTRTSQGLDRIRRAYQKKDFLQAKATLDQMQYVQEENRVVPVITVESGPKVVVRTQGAKVSKGRLRELVPIYQELTVDKDLLNEGKREITEATE